MAEDREAYWQRRLDRERRAREEAESLLDGKSRELFDANEKLQELTQDLEERVRERTLELEESQRDVTERHRQLLLSEKRFRDVTNAAGEYIWEVDLEGRYTFVTQQVTAVLGHSVGDVLGKTPFDFMDSEEADRVSEWFSGCVSEGLPFRRLVHSSRHADGHLIWQRVSGVPVLDWNGRLVAYRGAGMDISEIIQTQEDLRRSKEAAEAGTQAKSQFLANMSHEIRNPLNGIIGMLRHLRESNLTPDQLRTIQMASTSADSLLAVINDILDFSKVEAGKLDLEETVFELRPMLESLFEVLQFKAAAKGLVFVGVIDHRLPEVVRTDPSRLRQVLLNLADNAIKFTDEGHVAVITEIDKAGVRFIIKDTGIGIGQIDRERIFESFAQAETTSQRSHGGTGLGLAISKRLCELMKGDLSLDSVEGQGSTFEVVLPIISDVSATTTPNGENEFSHLVPVAGSIVAHYPLQQRMLREKLLDCGLAGKPLTNPDSDIAGNWLIFIPSGSDLSADERAIIYKARQTQMPVVAVLSQPDLSQRARGFIHLDNTVTVDPPLTLERLKTGLLQAVGAEDPSLGQMQREADSQIEDFSDLEVLVVDDNPINLQVARSAMERLGIRVDLANSGREAIQYVQRTAYDAIFMDIRMPEMDGMEATRKLRSLGCELPIIALTANVMQGDRDRYLEAGMNDHIAKPIMEDDLVRSLRLVFKSATNAESEPLAEEETKVPSFADITALFSGDETMARLVLEGFFEQTEKRMEEMESAIRDQDHERLADGFHSIAGSSLSLRCETLGRLCIRSEREARAGCPIDELGVLLVEVVFQYKRLRSILADESRAS